MASVMTSVSWQASDFSQFESQTGMGCDSFKAGGFLQYGFEEPQDKASETEVEPEPVPLSDSEVCLKTEMLRSEEAMLPAGLLDDIAGDSHKESANRSVLCSKGLQPPVTPAKPVDVSTTVSMLASVLGKNTALHYEADGRRISTTGGNDFVTANFPESREMPPNPSWPPSAQEISDKAQGFCNYYPMQYGEGNPYQGAMCAKQSGFSAGSWPASAAAGPSGPSMPGRFCVFCGKPKHSPNQRFCSHCGQAVVA